MLLRKQELTWLEGKFNSERAELIILYGRRRQGKTTLILEFLRGKKAVYLYTPRGSIDKILETFAQAIKSQLGIKIYGKINTFREFLEVIYDASKNERIVIAIDEFQRVAEADETAVSILQDFWDRKLKNTKIFLILIGSLVGMMEKIALKGDAPLFGRKTGKLKLSPLPYYRARKFWLKLNPEERIAAYGIFGGTPAYMDVYDFSKDFWSNVKEEIISKNGRLNDEPEQILAEELRSPTVYMAILERIAEGKRGLPLSKIKVGSANVVPYLKVLERMDIIERILPLGEKRKSIYSFKDEFFRFWFKYIWPNYWLIEMGRYDVILEEIKTSLNDYLSYTWEKVLRETISLSLGKKIFGVKIPIVKSIGPYWKNELEVDVLGIGKDIIIVGEAKWENKKLGLKEVGKVINKAELLAEKFGKKNYLVIIASKSGFKQEYEEKNILLWTLEDIERILDSFS